MVAVWWLWTAYDSTPFNRVGYLAQTLELESLEERNISKLSHSYMFSNWGGQGRDLSQC